MPSAFTRLWNHLAGGLVQAINDAGSVMTVQIKVGYLETHTLPVLQQFGFSSVPPVGSDALAHYVAGDRSNGVITGTNHQPSRPRGKNPGESVIYDNFGKSIYLTESGGIIVNANNSPVTVNNCTTLTINAATEILANTPLLKVSGDIIDNFGSNTRTMAAMRSIYDEHYHLVENVQSGGSNIDTQVPTQQM